MTREHYDEMKPCPKCHGLDHKLEYVGSYWTARGHIPLDVDAWLSVKCDLCGFSWHCVPFDIEIKEKESDPIIETGTVRVDEAP